MRLLLTYAVWIALAVVVIAVLPAILRGRNGGGSGGIRAETG